MTKLYEHDGKTFEVIEEDGVEIINSPTKPGPGWVQAADDLRKFIRDYRVTRQNRMHWIKNELIRIKGSNSENI